MKTEERRKIKSKKKKKRKKKNFFARRFQITVQTSVLNAQGRHLIIPEEFSNFPFYRRAVSLSTFTEGWFLPENRKRPAAFSLLEPVEIGRNRKKKRLFSFFFNRSSFVWRASA